MVIVFQVHWRTTSIALFKKVSFHNLQIQVSLPLLNFYREIPVSKEKGNLIYIYAMVIFNLGKTSF